MGEVAVTGVVVSGAAGSEAADSAGEWKERERTCQNKSSFFQSKNKNLPHRVLTRNCQPRAHTAAVATATTRYPRTRKITRRPKQCSNARTVDSPHAARKLICGGTFGQKKVWALNAITRRNRMSYQQQQQSSSGVNTNHPVFTLTGPCCPVCWPVDGDIRRLSFLLTCVQRPGR